MMEMEDELKELEMGMRWRGALTGVIAVGWIAFVVLWLLVFAGDYDVYKNIAVVLGTLVLAIVAVMVTWMSAFGKYMSHCGEAMKGVKGLSWRFGLSMVLIVAAVVTVLVWLWFFASDFNGYQNLGVMFLVLMATAMALWATWATFHPMRSFGYEGNYDTWSMCSWMNDGTGVSPCEGCVSWCPMSRRSVTASE
ncbi:MAG: hypothetical protein JSW25_04210 [Thermoplasmata archaeon]|nr:MAG: hypothetical protein JSW25_04210 [Thermoplasmata archaeon]